METKEVGTLIERPLLCQSRDPHREDKHGNPVTCTLPFGHLDGPHEGRWNGVVVHWGYPIPNPPSILVKAVEGKSEVVVTDFLGERVVQAAVDITGDEQLYLLIGARPLKDPAAFESWVQDAAQIFRGHDTPPVELEVAWSRIEHRAQLIKNQLEAGRDKASAYSYIKSTALLLAMRAAQAALDSLSELIPA